jgi:hypothetical protein
MLTFVTDSLQKGKSIMNTLPDIINQEINTLPLISQKEVLDFVLFLKNRISTQTDTDYLSNNADSKQAIIDGLNTPLDQCSESLDW